MFQQIISTKTITLAIKTAFITSLGWSASCIPTVALKTVCSVYFSAYNLIFYKSNKLGNISNKILKRDKLAVEMFFLKIF